MPISLSRPREIVSSAMVRVAVVVVCLAYPTQQRPQFLALTDLVQVDVVVTDRNDRPVPGLGREDFEIIERGQPQQIADSDSCPFPLGGVLSLPRSPRRRVTRSRMNRSRTAVRS